jgi:putative endonuclease
VKQYYVYILASAKNGTLYIGITSDLIGRTWQHKEKCVDGFSSAYNVNKLVHFEIYDDPETAIRREKRLKKYRRLDKLKLIERNNPQWNDLYSDII